MTETRIPITLLTGFLGSGKTTLLNYWLQHRHDKKIAVIENEFANYAFDAAILDANAVVVETVSNGCICCSETSALGECLINLAADTSSFSHVVIEATGVAFPAEIVSAILNSEATTYFYIDAVICLADVTCITDRLAQTAEAAPQIAIADVVLLSKTDGASAAAIASAKTAIAGINPFANIYKSVYGAVNGVDLLNQKMESRDKTYRQLQKVKETSTHSPIKSMVFEFEEPFDFLKLNFFLNAAGNFLGNELYRIKGFVYVAEETHRMMLQSAGRQHTWLKAAVWGNDKPYTKLVFIGKGLNRAEFQHHLTDCLAINEEISGMDFL
jgi:G3E family GTPase